MALSLPAKRRIHVALERALHGLCGPGRSVSPAAIEPLEGRTLFTNVAGTLDTQFGSGGFVQDQSALGRASAIAVQQDDKSVVVGDINSAIGLERFNFDGSIDTTFGTNGLVAISAGGTTATARAVAIQSDGKIVVTGDTVLANGDTALVLARFNTDGSLDTSFSGGLIVNDIGSVAESRAVAIDTDGSVVIAGDVLTTPSSATSYDWLLRRYSSTGTLQNSVIQSISTGGDEITSIALQSDRKIVASTFFDNNGPLTVARFNTDFSLDSTFGSGNAGGRAPGLGDFTFRGGNLNDVAIQPDGKIVAVGQNQGFFVAVRYNTNGTLDSSFGESNGPIGATSGFVLTDVSNGFDEAYSVVIQSTGAIVAVGGEADGNDGAAVRWTSSGDVDTTFANNGIAINDFGGSPEQITGAAQNLDGSILTSVATFSNGGYHFTAARYLGFNSRFTSVAVGDFNGDNHPDVVYRDSVTGQDFLRLMNGTSIISDNPMLTQPDRNAHIVGIGDFDGDGLKDDLVWQNYQTNNVGIWIMQGTSIVRAYGLSHLSDSSFRVQGVMDVDHDGHVDDIVLRNFRRGVDVVWVLNGSATAVAASGALTTDTNLNHRLVAAGNFSGGSSQFADDFVVQDYVSGNTSLWLDNGPTLTSTAFLLTEPSTRRVTGIGDFNGDGKDDLLTRVFSNGNNPILVLNGSTANGFIAGPTNNPAIS